MYMKNLKVISIIILYLILGGCNIMTSSQKDMEFKFCRMNLYQGDYRTKPGDFNKQELLNLSHVLLYYGVPFKLDQEFQIIVNQTVVDTNFWYNIYVKSQDSTWLKAHPLTDKR